MKVNVVTEVVCPLSLQYCSLDDEFKAWAMGMIPGVHLICPSLALLSDQHEVTVSLFSRQVHSDRAQPPLRQDLPHPLHLGHGAGRLALQVSGGVRDSCSARGACIM